MLDPGVVVTKQMEDAKYDRDGTRASIIRVEFYVDKHGPFVERFPKETYTAAARDAKLNAFAREVKTP
jgi:hypothetical protein